MKVKTSDLIGPALDWAVAKAEGRLGATIRDETRPGTSIIDIDFDEFGELVAYMPARRGDPYIPYAPSADWAQGGPIIDREGIDLNYFRFAVPPYWTAHVVNSAWNGKVGAWAPTPLVAAMRCYVASKLGSEVDVPEELMP